MKLRTAIVDDETLARERLKLMLATLPDLEVVLECRDGDEALEQLESAAPDLLFLDIQMPGVTGLELARKVGTEKLPPTIFLTAYREFAVEAFELEAVDYLTKPVELPRLRQAVQRVRQAIESKDTLTSQRRLAAALAHLEVRNSQTKAYASRLMVPDGPKDVLLPVHEVEWIEASDYYSSLHARQRTFLLRESLSDLEQRLDPEIFLRVHRSAIVNLNYVGAFHREGVREGTVTLRSGTSIRISKTGRQRIRTLLES